VPLIVRFDPLIAKPRLEKKLVLNVDLAPTIAELARVPSPGAEGKSLLPLIEDPDRSWRSDFVIEHFFGAGVPSYCAVRNETHIYILYSTGFEELYDLSNDPAQLNNVANQPGSSATLQELRVRTKELCQPPPPTFTFPY
jgi:N-acetylglucosamine-6-sulfatase